MTAKQVQPLVTAGRYGDGGNLYFRVRSATSRSWLFRYMLNGKSRGREQLARRIDPMDVRPCAKLVL